MAVKRTHTKINTTYFVTFTCYKWLPLFEITNLYDDIYKWFDLLNKEENFILGYVILPNHLHAPIRLSSHSRTINRLIAEGKRFRAYEIIKRLRKLKLVELLNILEDGINNVEKKKGSIHKVFEVSFDCKECFTTKFILQKLRYMHNNPVKAGLVKNACDYVHSSAKYYETGVQGIYEVRNLVIFKFITFNLA